MFLRYFTESCSINSPYLHVVMVSIRRMTVVDMSHATDTMRLDSVWALRILPTGRIPCTSL